MWMGLELGEHECKCGSFQYSVRKFSGTRKYMDFYILKEIPKDHENKQS